MLDARSSEDRRRNRLSNAVRRSASLPNRTTPLRDWLPSDVRCAWALAQMNRRAAKEDHAAVLKVLERTFTVGHQLVLDDLPIWATIRYALSAHYSGDAMKCLDALKSALVRLDREAGGFSSDDREYLYFLCKWIAAISNAGREAFALALTIGGSFDHIAMTRVSRVLRMSFPIKAVEARQIDAYVASQIARIRPVT